ncbi:uncharacterized protein LOC6574805 isoform X1 [Drosophila mojavensis]|uniref:Uncharacterized protein n=1 Tax=Drosophila mojavensis TaxID=7230 RepID=B4K6J4_DROMO|nr:uncharacterized protein LOC6574805 isoform X1 [Drosophila mojavensis]EDW16294.1 uncharacterized protein Dmoj_GI22308 [Drosophila mojavensis]
MKSKLTRTVSILLFLSVLHECRGRGGVAAAGQSLIQLSHDDDLDDNYSEIKDEVHLEDFFWTGSGDGPPDYLKKVHTGISKGKDVIVKTETVVATVYVDGNNEIEIPICLDCKPDDGGGNWDLGTPGVPPFNYTSTDRRYWLLTVMSGFYTAKDNPMLEERLARLYRLAFTRQQTRHLGINGAQQIAGVAIDATRERRQPGLDMGTTTTITSTTDWPGDDVEILDMEVDTTHQIKTMWAAGEEPEWAVADSSESGEPLSSSTMPTTATESIDYSAYVTLIPWELIQQNGKSEKLQEMREALLSQQQEQPQPQPIYREERVRVVIHNITQISEAELQKWNSSANDVADSDAYVNLKFNERPVANQTELIYTVLVNGRPVLATTAAKDMELVSEAEAAKTLGKAVYMKSEPYIREPTATALAPVPRSGHAGFFNSVKNNVALVVISSLAILLLMLLLVAILLLGRTRARQRELSAVNRTTSRNELLSEGQSMRPSSRGTLLDSAVGGSAANAEQSTVRSRDVGVQNFSYEREPRISFPAPPAETHTRTRHDSISSTDNTSDSSVYCPINPPSADVQRILDDKAARLFDGHKRRRHQYDRAEDGLEDTIYASVVSEKKSEKSRHKSKRRYLNENRVGSLETSPVQGSLAQSNSSTEEGNSPAAMRRNYENFQRNEAYNPNNNYHRNKLLQQQQTIFSDKELPEEDAVGSPQAINREMIRSRGAQPSEKSSDTASVGSFLSMASVRAFPKSTLPEPLNRVLDPVFVTYYDNVNAVAPQATAPQNSNRSLKSHKSLGSRDSTIATIASFPSPKAPPPVRNVRSASHSDNPDPGFVGPVVWERHKKRLNSADNQEARSYADFSPSPMHDASAIRNHYEGLLEGAMQMYASQDDLPMPLPSRDFTNKRRTTKREHRGSSAGLPSFPPKAYSTAERPATAQPEKTPKSAQSTQPPSPTYSAWGSSLNGSHSPLVRPLSAGPFQRQDTILEISRGALVSSSSTANTPGRKASAQSASAAPLIEAIQSELRKFKQQKD